MNALHRGLHVISKLDGARGPTDGRDEVTLAPTAIRSGNQSDNFGFQ